MNRQSSRISRHLLALVISTLTLSGVGCTMVRNAGTGTHLDAERAPLSNAKDAKKRDMLVEVTTDASGAVATVVFKRSSGAEPIDNYVAETIHKSWPSVPSTVTLSEITYSVADGFSQPRMISSHPAP